MLANKAEKAGDLKTAKSEYMASMAYYNMALFGRSYVWKNNGPVLYEVTNAHYTR